MTEHERLIKLLNDVSSAQYEGDIIVNSEMDIDTSEMNRIADYLLANGVILSPVKVGETVYSISRGQIIPIQIDTIQYTKRGIDISGSNEEYFGYSTIHLDINNQIGIQWYKTKEEAEKSLKGGIENENHNRST